METQCRGTAERQAREPCASPVGGPGRGAAKGRPREPRVKVFLRGRVQTGDCWADLTIYNVSSRGLMAQCGTDLARGRYVEVRCGSQVLVGRVVWCGGGRFGLRTRDTIDLPGLLGKQSQVRAAERAAPARPATSDLFRQTTAEEHATNRRLSQILQFAGIASMAVAAALLLAGEVRERLAKPLGAAVAAMGAADLNSSQTP